MKVIRAGFRADDDLRTATATEFGGIGIGQNFEFLNCVEYWPQCEIVDGGIIVVYSIKNVAVRRLSGAGRVETATKTENRARGRS